MLARSSWFGPLVLASFLALAAPPAQSQCGPDNLTGTPCCAPTFANIPQIPAMQLDCRWLCYNGCNVSQNFLDCLNLGPPIPVTANGQILCGVYDIRFRTKTCGTTNFLWNGSVRAFYTRTWSESSVVGAVNLQVWRFVVNGDLIPTTLLPVGPCRKPACMNNFTRCYFSGYIDYAFDCVTGVWSVALAVSHECDAIHHAPGTSRPAPAGGAHPTRSFSIVAPGTGFVPAVAGPRSDGQVTNEAIRWNNWAPAPAQLCTFEEPVNGGILAQNEFCFCTTGGPGQYISTIVDVVSVCGSQAVPSPVGQFLQKRIGGWTVPGTFPGNEFVLFDFGWLNYRNGCTGTNTQEWFEGGETIGGYPATDFNGLPLAPEFEDWASSNNSMTNPAVKIGAPHTSNYLLYVNLP